MKFYIDDYEGKYVMHCKTEEEAKDFCAHLDSVGRKWTGNADRYIEYIHYDVYKEHTVYYFNEGLYGTVKGATKDDYTILEWSDFMNKEFTKANLKTGDVVKFDNGKLGIVVTEYRVIALKDDGWVDFIDITDDLKYTFRHDFDIVAVRRPNGRIGCCFDAFDCDLGTLVYERKEVVEMTLAEVCKALGKEIKIIK